MFLRDHRVSCTGTASYHASQLDIAVSIAVGMELSRVYLGVHYPSDIAAGYLVGVLWVSTVLLAFYYLEHPN